MQVKAAGWNRKKKTLKRDAKTQDAAGMQAVSVVYKSRLGATSQ